jgi:hypothetical protein
MVTFKLVTSAQRDRFKIEQSIIIKSVVAVQDKLSKHRRKGMASHKLVHAEKVKVGY